MLSTSTLKILKALDINELKRFGDFIKSPYHNTTTALITVYDAVLKSYPEYISKSLSYENMAKKIFGDGGESKIKRVKNLYSEFGNLLREFLGEEEFRKNNYERDVFIGQGLSNRSLFEDANKFINKSLEQNDNGLLTDSVKYNYSLRMNTQMLFNLSQMGDYFDKILNINEIIQEARIVTFLRDTYSYGNMYQFSNIAFDKEYSKSIIESMLESLNPDVIINYLKNTGSKYHSYIKIIYLLYYYAINDIDHEQFCDLKNEIFKTIHLIEKWEAYTIIARFQEIILLKLVPIDSGYNKDLFEIAKLFCELKIYPEHARYSLHIGFFRDIFVPTLNLKEYDWVENFVNEYSQYLNEDVRDNEQNYCHGVLSFKKGRHEKSLEFFSRVKPDYILVNINVRFYYIMNYIELKAFESARSALHAFKQFYKDNDDIPKKMFILIPDALKYLSEIIKCLEENKKFNEMLYKEANDGRRFYHRIYILEKMEKLK